MACKTISVLGAATSQVAIPSRLPQTQSDWQTFTQQLNTLFSQLSTTARRPAATSVPIQYATLFSSTLPPLQTTNCTVTADNSWFLFGGFSYKIVVTGSNASVVCGASGFPLPIPPNENWLLSVYGKCSGASQSFKMGLQTANNTYQNTVITDATATTVDRFAIPLNLVADDASQCTLRLDFPSASGQTFWFDGFQYEPSVSGSINPSPFLSTNIIAGSIVAQFITVAQLSALSANMGTLTAGKIQSSDGRFTIDCTNELITITDGTNTRMQIGEVSAGVYDVKIWNGSGTLLFDAATGLQYAGNSTQITQVINNNSGNGQLNVNPTGGVTSNLPHANQSNQTLQVIANNGGNGQLNVNPTGGVVSTLPYANHAPSVTTTIVNTPDGNGSYLGHGVVFQPHIHANQIGWGHFIGDTSGDYVGSIADTTAKRFLHGAMSTGVQGVISSGSQVNVNPSGGVTGNLPQANHDPTVLLSSVTGNQRNLIPDSGLKNVKAYWTDHSGGLITVTQNLDGNTNCFEYVGTGSPSGFQYQASKIITVVPGIYTLSAKGWTSNITSGSMDVSVVDPTASTNYGSVTLTNKIRVSAQITIPAGVSQVVVIFNTNNTTVTNGAGSGVQDMQFEPGSVMTAYRENTGDNLSGTLLIDTGNSNHVGNWQHSYMSTPVRTTLASTAGGDGSYLNTSQVFNRHLNQATQSGLADDATYLRWKATQQTAMSRPSQGHINDPTFTSVSDFWSGIGTASSGVFTLPAMTANQGFAVAYNLDGRGNINQIAVRPGDVVVMQITCVTAATGTVSTYWEALFVNAAGADLGIYPLVNAGAAGTTTIGAAVLAPANAVGMRLLFLGSSGISGGNNASVSNPVVRINHETVIDVSAKKAYADFTDNAAGGHVGKTQSNVADDSNAKMFRFGTLAGRPSAGTAGRIYHASDAGTNGITYRDTGSAWVGMAVGHLADINGTLDNTSDGSSRFAVASVDPNKKALIDFSQPGHSNANLQYFGGIQSGTCYDGQAITFNPAYASIPLVIFSGGGMSYSSVTGSATSQSQAFTASSLTTSGFTASLKLVSGGTLTARTDTFTTVTSGSEYQATLTNAPAYNNTYTVNWVLSLNSASEGTVYIRETNSSGTILFQKTYLPGQNGAKSTPVIWSGATGTSVIDISLVLSAGSGTIGPTTVTFTSGTAPSSVSAVPSTAPITWVAFPQT